MKFLIDEDVPVHLLKALIQWGHDAVRVEASSSDSIVANRAREEQRVLVTLDKDFANALLYPPLRFNIVHIRIHPPHKEKIVLAFQKLAATRPSDQWRGLIVLTEQGHLRLS